MCSETLSFSAKSLLFRYCFLEEFLLESCDFVLYLCLVPFHVLPSVGMTGFEPAAPRPPGVCATGLRHIPKIVCGCDLQTSFEECECGCVGATLSGCPISGFEKTTSLLHRANHAQEHSRNFFKAVIQLIIETFLYDIGIVHDLQNRDTFKNRRTRRDVKFLFVGASHAASSFGQVQQSTQASAFELVLDIWIKRLVRKQVFQNFQVHPPHFLIHFQFFKIKHVLSF